MAQPAGTSGAGRTPGGNSAEESAKVYKLAYEEGKRALADQVDELNGIRTRAVSFVAFVGSATAFLVGTGLASKGDRDWGFYLLASVASAASILTLVMVAMVLSPWRPHWKRRSGDETSSVPKNANQWRFRISSRALVKEWIDNKDVQPSEAVILQELALRYDAMAVHNERLFKAVRRSYLALILGGGAALLLWASLVWLRA